MSGWPEMGWCPYCGKYRPVDEPMCTYCFNGMVKGEFNQISRKAIIGEGSDIWSWNYIGRAVLGKKNHVTNWVHIDDGCETGELCNFQPHVYLTSGVKMGDRCFWANGARVNDIKYPTSSKVQAREPVKLGIAVVVGTNAVINAGLEIGDGAVLGTLANVTRDVPRCEVWFGNPAKYYCSREEFERKRETRMKVLGFEPY